MLEDQGVDVAGEQSVLRALGNDEVPASADSELLERLHRQVDAGVLYRRDDGALPERSFLTNGM